MIMDIKYQNGSLSLRLLSKKNVIISVFVFIRDRLCKNDHLRRIKGKMFTAIACQFNKVCDADESIV